MVDLNPYISGWVFAFETNFLHSFCLAKSAGYRIAACIQTQVNFTCGQFAQYIQAFLESSFAAADHQIEVGCQRGCIKSGDKNIPWHYIWIGQQVIRSLAKQGQGAAVLQKGYELLSRSIQAGNLVVSAVLDGFVGQDDQLLNRSPFTSVDGNQFTTYWCNEVDLRSIFVKKQCLARQDMLPHLYHQLWHRCQTQVVRCLYSKSVYGYFRMDFFGGFPL